MSDYKVIHFEPYSSYFLYENTHYVKKDFFEYLKRKKKQAKIIFNSEFVDNYGDIIFSLFVETTRRREKLYIKMDRKDTYVAKFRNLFSRGEKSKIKSKIKGRLLYTSAFVLLLLKPLKLQENPPVEETFVLEESDVLDGLFETYIEKDLEPLPSSFFDKFSTGKDFYGTEKDVSTISLYMEAFGFEESITPVYEKLVEMESQEYKHSTVQKYIDTTTQTIKIKELAQRTQKNSKKKNKENKYVLFETLKEEEIETVLKQVNEYISYMKVENKEFDLKHFVCKLATSSFFQNNVYTEDMRDTYAYYSSDNVIVWNTFQEKFPSYKDSIHINLHEVEHLQEDSCSCENGAISKDGISLFINVKFFEDSLLSIYDMQSLYDIQPFSFLYLKEYSAENVSSQVVNEEFATYLSNREFVDNLEFALSINPDYQLGSMNLDLINRDPISFFQKFPYFCSEKEELISYYQMLACYNLLMDDSKLKSYLVNISTLDSINPSTLIDIAEIEHTRLFYKNLIYLNQTTEENLIEYDLFLINLFEASIHYQNMEFLSIRFDVEDALLAMKKEFISYLEEKYNVDVLSKYYITYGDYTLEEMLLFDGYPKDLEPEKREYIKKKIKSLLVKPEERASALIKK